MELLLDGLALLITDGPAAAAPPLRQTVSVFVGADISVGEGLRWGWMAMAVTNALWDDDGWRAVLARHLEIIRNVGSLDRLPICLAAMGTAAVWSGDFEAAASVIAEGDAISEATGTRIAPFASMLLGSLQGREAEVTPLIEAIITAMHGRRPGRPARIPLSSMSPCGRCPS